MNQLTIDNSLILDSIPFTDFTGKNVDNIHTGWKLNIKYQSKIINDIICRIYGAIKDKTVKNYFIYGIEGTGKSFILKEIEKFLSFRGQRILFLDSTSITKLKRKSFKFNPDFDANIFGKDGIDYIMNKSMATFIIASREKNVKKVGSIFLKDSKTYKLPSLSIFETYNYINNSISLSFVLSPIKNKKIFSLFSVIMIYMLSAGRLSYINSISSFCLNLIMKDKTKKISIIHILKYIKKNLKTLHNVFRLISKYLLICICFVIVIFVTWRIYVQMNQAEFERIKEEIELQNLKYQ